MKRITLALSTVALIATAATLSTSCSKNTSCYDARLAQQYKNSLCTADCPGVTGCDGKTYCNACEANRRGIRVK